VKTSPRRTVSLAEEAGFREILGNLEPGAALEVTWKYERGQKSCSWVGHVFESRGKDAKRYWPVQYRFVDSADGRETVVESRLPQPLPYNGHEVVIMHIRPLEEEGPLRHVVLPPPPSTTESVSSPPLTLIERWKMDGEIGSKTAAKENGAVKAKSSTQAQQRRLVSQATIRTMSRGIVNSSSQWLAVTVTREKGHTVEVIGKVLRGEAGLELELFRNAMLNMR